MKTGARLAAGSREHRTAIRPRLLPSTPPIPGFSPRSEDFFAHLLRGVAPERLVLGAGAASTLIYLGLVTAFPIWKWWDKPHAAGSAQAINDMGRITGYSPIAALTFIAAILALFASQFLALTAASHLGGSARTTPRQTRIVRGSVLLFPVVFLLIMVWMQPVTTTDLYGYIARGFLYAQLHLDPMTTKAVQLPGGLAVDRPAAPYGPAWLLIAGLVSRLAGNNLLANMLAFKAIGMLGVLLALWLVDLLARRLAPERRLRIDVLFGWSPLLVFESIGNGHNDIAMVVCVLGAFALMLNRHSRLAFTLLVLGALIKYVSAVFIPLWLVYELRHRVRTRAVTDTAPSQSPSTTSARDTILKWARTAAGTVREVDYRAAIWLLASVTVIGGVLVVGFYAPFWDGLATFTGLGQQLRPLYYNSSIVAFVSAPLELIVPPSRYAALDKTVRLVFYALFTVYAYLQAQRLWFLGPQADIRHVITAAAKITFAALILITFWFQPWYVVWLLPLAALANEPFVRRQGTILAAGALLTYAVGNYLLVGEPGIGRDLFVQFFEILVAFAPLLLLRAAPYDQGWTSVFRRYALLLSEGLNRRPVFWERVMLVLIVVVAGLLRLVRLGNLFAQLPAGSSDGDIVRQASGDLRLFLSDPQGLHGPFIAIQGMLVYLFGPTPLAALLPSAIVGSLTVIAVYLLTFEIMRQGSLPGKRTVALLAALLAATSRWHVSLSRSGMEVVLLPLLMCLAVYWLLLALRGEPAPGTTTQAAPPAGRRARGTRRTNRKAKSVAAAAAPVLAPTPARQRRLFLLFAAAGICTGLATDVAPGLWLVPLLVAGVLLVWGWRRPAGQQVSRQGVVVLLSSAVLVSIPVIWQFASHGIGFPEGSDLLARSSVDAPAGPNVLSLAFWGLVAHNVGAVASLLVSQDYSAGYPSSGGTPIIPTLLGPFFYIGLLFILVRWRNVASLAMLMLVALPLVASAAAGTPTGVIEAADALPAMCLVPAMGIYGIVSWLGHLPIVLDRINGVRVFATPEQIGRVLLLVFLVVSAIRTFYWYFEVTLPSTPPNQYIPTSIGPNVASVPPGGMLRIVGPADHQAIHAGPDATLVYFVS